MKSLEDLRAAHVAAQEAYNAAAEEVQKRVKQLDDAPDETTDDEYRALNASVGEASKTADAAEAGMRAAAQLVEDAELLERARKQFKPVAIDKPVPVTVDEPDMYTRHSHSFIRDLYMRDCRNDMAAAQRLARHQEYEISKIEADLGEQRAVATATMGGVIPPQYLVDLYAKAARNGRIYANQANQQELPDEGMSLIVPRFTTGLTAGVQTAESATVATQDPTETDLTVPVRTVAGYSPVSRQTLERARYSEPILMEDLTARYAQTVDTQCLTGSGSSGQMLGLTSTSGTGSSTTSTATVAGIWPNIADCIQQIETAVGGLGYHADKIIMHPRRWGFFTSGLDGNNRPLYTPAPMTYGPSWEAVNNIAAGGEAAMYGFTGSMILGLPVYTDANIPTNLGAGTNQDIIIVQASQVVHLWERPGDPITLSFEQQAGTSLQVQLVAYGYAAFTAGRYPAASATVSGTGLVTPTFV